MRWSESCIPTMKENPREAEIPSHRLMLRAGLIKKLTAGIYTFLPLGLRVLKKIESIVREEMNAAGCQELLMPILHPEEIYAESGRLETFGPELYKVRDGRQRVFALGPTHEEVVTMIARDEMRSYRDLPQCLYQILTKFRDEIRPRYGVMRAREFIMKDAYSFHTSEASLDRTYREIEKAYQRIIERCGLRYRIVEAESGYIGGNESHEFMVLAENGEDRILSCGCGYAVNLERATAREKEETTGEENKSTYKAVDTPGAATVDEVSQFLRVTPRDIVKTLLYRSGDRNVALLVPGDREVNDIKLCRNLDDSTIRFLEAGEIDEVTGGPVGFSGPVGLPPETRIVADETIKRYSSMIVGANKADKHLVGVVPGRDFVIESFNDYVYAREGDLCARCGKPMELSNGVEVGHIFKLGTKYSRSMNAKYLDEKGESHPFIMGCYGFGISRMVAAAIEQNFDDDGIIWPLSIAPFQVLVLPINMDDQKIKEAAESLERGLKEKGIEVLLDDRDLSPGVKFKDAELIGIPLRLTLGRKLQEGKIEIFDRASRQVTEIPVGEAVAEILKRIAI
ncbi:MAG: proline--tRNA ligase [Candidatus Krumholzibacteriota bacterium]|nr:proline--tRNA ligase [Candidatus Krumholzibacteriota bacterium]